MEKIVTNKTNHKQGVNKQDVKSYSQIKLTVYGKMVKLTAGGSGQSNEGSDDTNLTKRP